MSLRGRHRAKEISWRQNPQPRESHVQITVNAATAYMKPEGALQHVVQLHVATNPVVWEADSHFVNLEAPVILAVGPVVATAAQS